MGLPMLSTAAVYMGHWCIAELGIGHSRVPAMGSFCPFLCLKLWAMSRTQGSGLRADVRQDTKEPGNLLGQWTGETETES